MKRYQPHRALGSWAILDQRTCEVLPTTEAGGSRASATALSELLNQLEGQQQWRKEADLWPQTVA